MGLLHIQTPVLLALTIILFLIGNSHSLSCNTCARDHPCELQTCLSYLPNLGLGSNLVCLDVLKDNEIFMKTCSVGDNWNQLSGGDGQCAEAPMKIFAEAFNQVDTAFRKAKEEGKIPQSDLEEFTKQGMDSMQLDVEKEGQSSGMVTVCSCTPFACNSRQGQGPGPNPNHHVNHNHHHGNHSLGINEPHDPLSQKIRYEKEDDDDALSLSGNYKMVIILALGGVFHGFI